MIREEPRKQRVTDLGRRSSGRPYEDFIMLNLLLTLLPVAPAADRDEGFVGKLALWMRQQARYHQAILALRRLDNDELDELGIGRADFPELAWRHASGAAPLMRPYR